MSDWPADLPANLPVVVSRSYDLKQEIQEDVGAYSKESLIKAIKLVKENVGAEAIEKSESFSFANDELIAGEDPNHGKMIRVHLEFSEEDKARDPRYEDKVFWIYDGVIIEVRAQ